MKLISFNLYLEISKLWIPFFSAIAGGSLVLIGQSIDRKNKKKIDRANNLRETYANARRLEALMKNNYRELAMAKTHVEYWWYCHVTTPSSKERDRYYEEHLRSQSIAREVERKIGETKADFIGQVRKFQTLKELKPEIETQLDQISDLTNKKAKSYDINLSYSKVRNEIVNKDEDELRDIYYLNLKNFKSVNDYLFTKL